MALRNWVLLNFAFIALALIISYIIYYNFPSEAGKGIAITLLTLLAGGSLIWTTRAWIRLGSDQFWTYESLIEDPVKKEYND